MLTALTLPFVIIFVIGMVRFFLMSPRREHRLSEGDAAVLRTLRLTGVLILAGGLLSAGLVFWKNPPQAYGDATGYYLAGGKVYPIKNTDSKAYELQMENIGGKADVIATAITDWWHGRKLAYTLAALSLAGFLLCFSLAHLQAHVPPSDHDPSRPD